MGKNCHNFYEPSDQQNLDGEPVTKEGGTKIRLCGKGKHIEEITERLERLGFRERETRLDQKEGS